MDFFKDLVVKRPSFITLTEGKHHVRLAKIQMTNSFLNYDGSEKESVPEWSDPTPQLAVTFVASGEGEHGGITHRFNGCGFIRFDDLEDEQIKSGKYEEFEGYAVKKDKKGNWNRIVDEKKTEDCKNILSQIAYAVGLEEGDNLMDGLEEAIAEKTEIEIEVENKPYNSKDQYRVKRTSPIKAMVEEDLED